jgi:5'-deoxynucleotidase YfbR-like HD superfamily hydrolase
MYTKTTIETFKKESAHMDLSKQPTTNYLTISREIDVLSPESFEPRLSEILTALPKINRFNGQTMRPYSVAMHSVMCTKAAGYMYDIKKPHLLLAILMHDAAEAYLGDIVRPVKQFFNGKLSSLENIITYKIFSKVLGLTNQELNEINEPLFLSLVKEIDSRMALTELMQLREDKEISVLGGFKPFSIELPIHVSWSEDEQRFTSLLSRLTLLHNKTKEC